MQKVHVIDARDGSQMPFLRGILTRSIQKSGVPFDDAYSIADSVRDEIAERETISTADLRAIVYRALVGASFKFEARIYRDGSPVSGAILIVENDGSEVPFSKGRLSQSMEICGLDQETTYQITKSIELDLRSSGSAEFRSSEVADKTHDAIVKVAGAKYGERYLQWRSFTKSGRPLILLVGGTTGSGKSTISSELAHRLDIVRTQSTDMLREVMRLMIPARLIPTLHSSSFLAHTVLPHQGSPSDDVEEPSMITGYLSQADHVSVGIEGVLNRAENEQVSLIIEGVHIHPALQRDIGSRSNALVVPIVLAVLKKKKLRKRLLGRGQRLTSRRSERYLEHFDEIWDLQSFFLSQADHFGIPIVDNEDEEDAIHSVMHLISDRISSREKTTA